MAAMEGRLSSLLSALDTRLDKLEKHGPNNHGQGSPSGTSVGVVDDELAHCLQTLNAMEATELEIRCDPAQIDIVPKLSSACASVG
eukprot:scaffold230019_cov22-Prasinocladus_malaysianus.AAC.2